MSLKESTKTKFEQSLTSIIRNHERGAGGIRTTLALTKRLDSLLSASYRQLQDPNHKLLSIVALGGYGRKEVCFYSDVDIMILIEREELKERTQQATHNFLHSLLDSGLDVGHSFRTIEECVEFSVGEIETWLSLLESRFVCGNAATYNRLSSRIRSTIKKSGQRSFIQRIEALTNLRHQKYGDSTTLLEPNIKNSAGGLRDLHTVLWLFRGLGKDPLKTSKNLPAIAGLLRSGHLHRQFGKDIANQSLAALNVLLRTRNEMHLRSQSHHDTLEFSFQPVVANGLHFRASKTRTNVERFMQEYYIASRHAAQLLQRTIIWSKGHVGLDSEHHFSERLDNMFSVGNGKLQLLHPRRPLTSEIILKAFVLSAERGIEFSFQLEDRIHHARRKLKPLRSTEETALFRRLLNQRYGLAKSLHRMNDLGILECWIPEWKPMVAFFQHNMYHYYTADEHTLRVVDNAELLGQESSLFGEVFRALPRKDILYLACLFHDIAKPLRIGDHEIVGVEMANTILHRLGYDGAAADVGFLIRHHLVMEQIAFRRNLNDPQTIVDFAARFQNASQLDLLFVLTYADLSAVNKNVWTQWKEMLLTDLYRKTSDVLAGVQTSQDLSVRAQQEIDEHISVLLPSLTELVSADEAKTHLGGLGSLDYFKTFATNEIADHIRNIGNNITASTLFKNQEDFTEVTLIARDAPYALSRCCGVLTANDANILDAHIFTRNDGMIIDKFRVSSIVTSSALTEQHCARIESDMRDIFEGRIDVAHLLERHRLRWKRRTHPLNPNIRFDVEFEEHSRFTIIDVYAADRIGFLYKVTETMSNLGLNISFAKIATRVDGIVDSFYVLDRFGNKICEPKQKDFIREEILDTMRAFFELELSGAGTV